MVILVVVLAVLVFGLLNVEIPLLGQLPWPISWLVETSLEFLAISFFIFLGSILFPWVLSLVIAFFLEEIVTVVRERNYNNEFLETTGNCQAIIYAVKFGVLTSLINLVCLPIYLILLFFPIMSLVFFYLVNGLLLGREYYGLVTIGYVASKERRAVFKENRLQVYLAGLFIAFMMTIPFINLIAPVLGSVMMVHLLEVWRVKRA
tara:strand:+ start:2478 stop:3092 length:615 start_codon:yes stop_codon:yes gene_type:complete